eukprot:TRINITY_DN3140_c0_g1_i1.p5 TRINITY_DN3140_c0_g1~~TRINITY_DN3140_c0_g1_i1.p5  ORF type:complete len:106 (-),score=9.61 TRINITY_DN3140_c0_g1_i1:56-373(-)
MSGKQKRAKKKKNQKRGEIKLPIFKFEKRPQCQRNREQNLIFNFGDTEKAEKKKQKEAKQDLKMLQLLVFEFDLESCIVWYVSKCKHRSVYIDYGIWYVDYMLVW